MENRFGIKDAILISFLVVIIAMLWLKMVQDDRQWESFNRIQTAIDQQTKDVTALRRMIAQGGLAVQNGDGQTTGDHSDDILRRIADVRKKPDFAQGDMIIESFNAAPPSLNYLTAHDVYSRVVYSRVLEPLASFDIEKLKLVPYLATSWTMADDGLSMDVKLRKNVAFSDGVSMTADDVVYTWWLQKNEEIVDGNTIEYLRHISKVEKLDDYAVRFHFEKVFYENELRALEEVVLPKHFFEKFTEREIRENKAMLMGTGPYKMRDPLQYSPDKPMELVRNERYWGVPGPWDQMKWLVIEKESAEYVAFQNGDIDVFLPTPEQHLGMLKDPLTVDRTQHQVFTHVRSGYGYMAWNQKRDGKATPFAKKAVRQAMTMLVDRERIAKEKYFGFASVANGPFHPEGPQFNKDVPTWPYDPARAVALLKGEGFTQDANGRMITPDGEPFEIEMIYPAGSALYQQIMFFVKDNLAEAGISLKLKPQKWVLLLQSLKEKTFDAITLGWGAGGIEGDIEQMFHSRNVREGGDNRNHYVNPKLDALVEKAHVTLDYDERMKLWKQCHQILHEDQPYTFMHRRKALMWMDKRFKNVKSMPAMGINRVTTWPTPIEWYVPKDKQKYGANANSN